MDRGMKLSEEEATLFLWDEEKRERLLCHLAPIIHQISHQIRLKNKKT
jgi:hypothetical protein